MASKKRNRSQNQPTLSSFMNSEVIVNEGPFSNQQLLSRQIDKLKKVRKEIYRKQLQENKIIKKILNLQINEIPQTDRQQYQQHEEYLILTTEQSLKQISDGSIFKLILGDYGQIIIPTPKHIEEIDEIQTSKQTEIMTKQWREHGNINSEYIKEYQPQFIHYLNSMQYVADQLGKMKRIQRS